ncbi:DUF192 domain-containing protein [Yoonia litorea]|uniref:DUF192 domain-containing protein n=1 Tax=Yoonia litorea TaxID=1123755 RepID=A0A1I6M9Z6_9RHOB|nr:DUF192 domain-containing protein [Yoonia litorea]SFS12529.1 hypothetical protein SAMN05444714_1435 [Yoonia litorea]
MIRTCAAVLFLVFGGQAYAACADDKVTVQGEWGQATFQVAVADDVQERAQGLMFVESMPLLSGMLFVYERPQSVSFWMRNTLIPLDMIFVAPSGEVLRIHENAIPGDLTPIPGGEGVQFVLEINGGLSSRLGIAEGDLMQHPSFGPDAILACDEKSQS